MKLIFLVTAVLATVLSTDASLVGPKECTFGPSYWCHSIRSAKTCNAVTHCIQTVWQNQVLPKDDDGICQICVDMVQQARDTLQSNDTQEMIKLVFEGSCNLIPIGIVASECRDLVDGFIPELIETLSSEMNPQVVCATAGLCNSVTVDRLLRVYLESHPELPIVEVYDSAAGNPCTDCHTFLQDLSDAVKHHARTEVMDHLLSICGKISSLADGCRMLVEINFEDIYNFLAYQMNSNEICKLFGLCGSFLRDSLKNGITEDSKVLSVNSKVESDVPCEFCIDIVKHWRDQLASDTTEEQFKEILNGICSKTGTYEVECKSLVDQYYQPLYNMLVSEIHPKEICEAVGICGASSVFKNTLPIWTLLDVRQKGLLDNNMIGLDEANSYQKGGLVGQDEADLGKQWYFIPNVNQVDSMAHIIGTDEANSYKKGRLIGEDEANSYKKGSLVGQDEADSDKKYFIPDEVNQEHSMGHIIGTDEANSYKNGQLIGEDEANSYKRGSLVGQDEANSYKNGQTIPWAKVKKISVKSHGKNGFIAKSDVCVMCEFALHYLQDLLQDRKTRKEVENEIKNLCLKMPHSIAEQCEDYVDAYGDQLIQLIILELNPSMICPMIHMCPGKTLTVKEDVSCVLCEYAMTQLDQMLRDNKTEENIKHSLEKLCTIMPKSIRKQCKDFVDAYTDQIISMLINDLTPDQVCTQLGLCKDDFGGKSHSSIQLPIDRMFIMPVIKENIPTTTKVTPTDYPYDFHQPMQCVLCEFIMIRLQDVLTNKSTEKEIEKEVSKICILLPHTLMHDCLGLVEAYGDAIIDMLNGYISPEQVCRELKLCKGNSFVDALPKATVKVAVDACTVCEEVVDVVDQKVKKDHIPETVEDLLKNVCTSFKEPEKELCSKIVSAYGPYITRLLDELQTPKKVCQALKVCPVTNREAQLLGAKKCTYGPEYWCQTKMHADACGAMDHCKSKVWGSTMPIPAI